MWERVGNPKKGPWSLPSLHDPYHPYGPVLLYVTNLPLLLPFPPTWAPLYPFLSPTPNTGCWPAVTRISHPVLGCSPEKVPPALTLALHARSSFSQTTWEPSLFFNILGWDAYFVLLSLLLGSESLYWSVLQYLHHTSQGSASYTYHLLWECFRGIHLWPVSCCV